jgi:hypothetical protein
MSASPDGFAQAQDNIREYLANKQIFCVAPMVDRDIMPVSKSERAGSEWLIRAQSSGPMPRGIR